MNVTSKLDLDGMLNDWPAPAPSTNDEEVWEARAAHIVEAALSRRSEDTATVADLLAPPDLTAAPGEEQAGDLPREARASGEHSTMADGSRAGRASKSEASLSGGTASRPPEKRRQSLKEIAERVSQAPGRAGGVPGVSGSALSTPLPSGRGALTTPLPPSGRSSAPPGRVSPLPGRGSLSGGARASSPSLRSTEGTFEDSGVIDLNRLSASVPPETAASEKAQPDTADRLGDERAAAEMPARIRRAPAAPVAQAPAKKRSGGVIAGAAIAALGLAAAVTVMVKTTAPPQQEIAATASPAPTTVAAPAAPRDDTRIEPAAPVAAAPAESVVVEQPVHAEEKVAAAPKAPAAPVAPAPTAAEAPAAPVVSPKPEQGKIAAAPAAAGKSGDLPSAMQAAVGENGERQPSVVSEAPVPASGPLRQQNIPEQPSQGSVQAALGSVMGGAKACVAGADDVSRAQITFSSTGQVSKVNVSGWAASNGQSSCVQSALKGANVGPFSKPSFSVSATIRP
ncbi:hypothetical protein WME90_45490 [Sorangium sp. So ce375]|uniref:hypothetical protein n=1 Tax=Sorangium sp. So ce375 TaxID=3133306 RepID=UPI003F5B858A